MSMPPMERDSCHAINATNTVTCFAFSRFLPALQCVESNSDGESQDFSTELPLFECSLKIEHSTYTDIELVGLQVWSGALLLSEFIIHCGNSLLCDKNVLELASGTGLVSIIAGMYCSHVTCTDLNEPKVLKTIEENVNNNRHLINASVSIQPFDFFCDWSPAPSASASTSTSDVHRLISDTEIIVVSEVIYDNRLTDAFIEQLVKITSVNPKIYIYITIERRYIFSAVTLRTEAPHYEYFFERLRAKQNISKLNWRIKRMKIDFPHYFKNYYKRSKHLQLWRISSKT
ncbi:methyltransferase-like protein 22 [Planococcus citri]|uniref:methyltransferase-like protein 22 n=1 Tax=Planococcus citri TaxID=170843 RepID=UPI0031F88F24